ncbi:RND family efflux transporter MFP subunit [Methylovorus glucosotrophus]|jgi:RND family efflux transporter MFP subunit|uniref:efflux RND transporter periplasmic adaptor subunit n=1 Tax=Methylovorus glucosotrophus TaxID=266009 RepID=UPI0013317EB5|nr:efflux RND transporter periplasmic adaptor subunit [Methylovorus glucosotrophus]KAF0843311.1 RND family efflux transporter MFP subunit [Methylovorus glucosotrophus]
MKNTIKNTMKQTMWICTLMLGLLPGQWVQAADIAFTETQQNTLGIRVAALGRNTPVSSHRLPAEIMIPIGQERMVSAPQSGLVDTLYVAAGEDVKAGQPLAHISSPELIALQRDYLQALTQYRLAQNNLKRDQELYQDGIIAKRRFQTTQSGQEELSALLNQRKQALQLAGMGAGGIAQLEKSGRMTSGITLTAPAAGQVLEQLAAVGQRVDLSAPIYRIGRLHPLWLEISAPLEVLPYVSVGMPVSVPKYGASGKLIHIVRSVNKNDQTVHLRATITTGTEKLAPGQFVEAEIGGLGTSTHFSVPRPAIARHDGKTYVFVKTAQGFRAMPVEVVSEQFEEVVINGDFTGKEQVAVSGQAAIKGRWLGLGAE